MAPRPVTTSRRVGEAMVHLHQAVRDAAGRDWFVVSLDDDIILTAESFDWRHTVTPNEFTTGGYTPIYAGDVPVWGY